MNNKNPDLDKLKDMAEKMPCYSHTLNTIIDRLDAAEAEIARRDKAAGEPFAYHYHYAGVETCEGFQNWRYELSREYPPEWMIETGKVKDVKELFTAAQPATLPPQIHTRQAIERLEKEESPGTVNVAYKWGYNQAIADAKALGCKAAGEPVHFYREHNPNNGMKTDWIEVDSMQLGFLQESTDPETAEFRTLYAAAQPDKVVVLPREVSHITNKFFEEGRDAVLELLDAAGVKWKEAE